MTDDDKKVNDKPENPEQGGASAIPRHEVDSLGKYISEVEIWNTVPAACWFRGHTDANWQLTPSIFRHGWEFKNERIKKLRKLEAEANLNFLYQAKARERNFPSDDNRVGQLVVARHHGLDSRLLDWTESPLTALFFAVERDGCKDGDKENPACVWILAPHVLNYRQWNARMIYYSHAPVPQKMAHCAFNNQVILKDISLEKLDAEKMGVVAAFKPQHTIMRHMVQKAQFTIHDTPEELDKLPDASEFLGKIIIPFNKRKGILDQLRLAGVSRDLLFPDLDNLAEHTNAEIMRRMEYNARP